MAHRNSDKVIGGIEQPRFLIVGDELSPNVSFEEDLNGISGNATYSRMFDDTTPFLDYVLKVEDGSTTEQQYIEITINAGEDIAEKHFILFAHARNDADLGQGFVWGQWVGLSGAQYWEKEFVLDQNWRRCIVHEIIVPDTATGQTLTYRIYPTSKSGGASETGAIRIDNLHVRKVEAEYYLPLPDRDNPAEERFQSIWQAKHELVDGSIKTYRKGYRYFYEGFYDILPASYEYVRSRLAETENEILFFPHKDSMNCYLVKWGDELSRKWAYGTAALGHEADIELIGQEIIRTLPSDIVDASNEYQYQAQPSYVPGGWE